MHQRLLDGGLVVEREPELPIVDENGNQVNFYRPDHRVEQALLVEYKAHRFPVTNDEFDLLRRPDLLGCSNPLGEPNLSV